VHAGESDTAQNPFSKPPMPNQSANLLTSVSLSRLLSIYYAAWTLSRLLQLDLDCFYYKNDDDGLVVGFKGDVMGLLSMAQAHTRT
jgi:hypothetical protein